MSYFDSILPKNTGTEILGMANESANASARDARSARIAELEAELAEIRKQKQSLDVEADMGKYKFQYDADPSTYVGVQQSRRNAEETRRIREANEKATARSQDQSALRTFGDGMFSAYYGIRNAENALKQAIDSGDEAAIRNAKTTLSQERALYKKNKDQYDELAARIMEQLGVKPKKAEEDEELDLDNDADVKAAHEYQALKGGIVTATDDLRKRPESMSGQDKATIIKNANKALAEFRQRADALGNLNPTLKAELDKTINAYQDAIPAFRKNQGTKMTAEKFSALTGPELLRYSLKELESFKKQGFKNYGLDRAIAVKKSGK